MGLRKIFKSLTASFTVLMLLMSIMPQSIAAAENSVTINFGAYSAADKAFIFMPQEITVSEGTAEENGYENAAPGHRVGGADHGVEDGEISVLDALVAAHIMKDGDASGISGSAGYVTGIFGLSGGIGFSIDGEIPVGEVSDGYAINEYVLTGGETVLLFTYGDSYWGDYTSYFDEKSITVNAGEEFTLFLEGYEAMETMWATPGTPTSAPATLQPIESADICIVNPETGALEETGTVTDANGEFTYSFDTAGEYIISATGTVSGSYGDVPIVAPVCFVTVEESVYENTFKLTVPAEAEAKVFCQNNNYNTSELSPLEVTQNENTKTYTFNVLPDSDAYSYRVSQEGKITKAGYIKGAEQSVTWSDEDYAPTDRIEYDKNTVYGSRGDDSLLLNVNARNHLVMEKDSTYRLRAYRIWQIINSDTMNKMIEPDFTYNIISGSDIIDITPVTEGNGNAKNNRLDINAKGDGTAIVEIGYNAIEILSGNQVSSGGAAGLDSFTYGACDPARTGLVVIQTENAATDIDFGIKSYSRTDGLTQSEGTPAAWDAEFDTLYFTGSYAKLEFMPQAERGSIDKVEFSNDKGETWTMLNADDGIYTARIVSGNNLIRVTKDDGSTAYQAVRGDKITASVTNITNPGENLDAGDTARIALDGVHFPVGKMAGIYNPGYIEGHKLTYTFEGETIKTPEAYQYNFPTNAYVDITIPADAVSGDTYTLSDGYIAFNIMGTAYPLSDDANHRSLTDSGAAVNMNASSTKHIRSILPDITVTVGDETQGGTGGGDDSGTEEEIPGTDDGDIDISDIEFDISDSEIKGYVTVSFEDYGERISGESGVICPNPLGQIIEPAEVPFKSGDTIAGVTLRLLNALGIDFEHSGSAIGNFYLSSIGDFTLNGKYYETFGEFDAGAGSGWMVTHNNWFINMGASEFEVQNGDIIKWKYTCRMGADIGCDWSNPSAEITGLKFKENYGTLSPAFDESVTEYTYTVPSSVKSICLEGEQENYWAKLTYTSGNKIYKPMEAISVSNGTIINLECAFSEQAGDTPGDTDSIKITIKVRGISGGSGGSGSGTGSSSAGSSGMLGSVVTPVTPTVQSPSEVRQNNFSDVKKDDWYYEAVEYVTEKELMQGTGKDFEPDSNMTRAMLVMVLYRLENTDVSKGGTKFTDVLPGQWYSDAVLWAAENGVVAGVSDTHFAPDDNITREQMAVIMFRYAKMKGYNTENSADISQFEDYSKISDWSFEALRWANAEGLIKGTSETTISPEATATRAQVAAILMRFCENTVK